MQSRSTGLQILRREKILIRFPEQFLSAQAYQPFHSRTCSDSLKTELSRRFGNQWPIDSAVTFIRKIIAEAYETKTRKLVLLTGVPGSGKTLVGLISFTCQNLKVWLEETKVYRLSGNGPLVALQYVLKTPKGSGDRTGNQTVCKNYSKSKSLVPSERVLVFDEAQRAHDRDQVANVHKLTLEKAHTEPDYLIEFAERIPDWSVIVGLIGSGQEINTGEDWIGTLGRFNCKQTQDGLFTEHRKRVNTFSSSVLLESPS